MLARAAAPWRWALPIGQSAPRVPADNAMSPAKIELGRRLFYDADLSIDGSMSCATCHEQHRAFADGNATHAGVHGDPGRRNVPGLANVAWAKSLTWGDTRIRTLEAQAMVPIAGLRPVEMGMAGQEAEIARRLGRDGCYADMFSAAFPEAKGRIDVAQVAKALAAFERTLISFDSPYDRWQHGDATAMPAQAAAGRRLFVANCAACHSGPLLSDGAFHRIIPPAPGDSGLGETNGRGADNGRFRTPSLRNVALTAPYFHDGSAPTIEAAIRRHPGMAATADGNLLSLTAFLSMLTDRHFVTDKAFALPDVACGKAL
ncbi:cytochrome-c peroxidase [Sphingomonas sp. QA11]|uniref:cytochrome-c peroxidase n=1 Tax=Sphingomonas sp. QA11 TaxID=2950605 RepID=UPI00234A86F7|nr:cytochrome c peroxidase [Sphingomonas sp. QA11]WCM29449.1 cytochrome-c peroxidase [Sphingomonas sp. QA11]